MKERTLSELLESINRLIHDARVMAMRLEGELVFLKDATEGEESRLLFERAGNTVAEFIGLTKEQRENMTPASNFSQDYGVDSLDLIGLVMHIEEEFDIELDDANTDQIETMAQLVTEIKKQSA